MIPTQRIARRGPSGRMLTAIGTSAAVVLAVPIILGWGSRGLAIVKAPERISIIETNIAILDSRVSHVETAVNASTNQNAEILNVLQRIEKSLTPARNETHH